MLLTPGPPSRPYHSQHGKRLTQINKSNQNHLPRRYCARRQRERLKAAPSAGFSLARAAQAAASAAPGRPVLSSQLTYFPSSAARCCLQASASGGCGLQRLERRRTQRANSRAEERRAAELRLVVQFGESALIINGATLT